VGCTKANPSATCANGACSDPEFPFCDVDGSFGGPPNTCIAVTCAAGSIGGCRGSDELVCNSSGDTYDTQACSNGCTDPTGCNAPPVPTACTANTTTCTSDGSLLVCDATGQGTPQTCALGCSDTGGSHCEELVPSNNLQQFFDKTPNPADLTLAGGTLDLDASTFTPTGGKATSITSFKLAAPSGGAPLTVFVANNLTLGDITIDSTNNLINGMVSLNGGVGPGVAFLAKGEVQVQGRVLVASGAVNIPGCTSPATPSQIVGNARYAAGAGGGGHATDGADGGDVPGGATHLAHGSASGTDQLVPLRGGCPAGLTVAASSNQLAGRGGGAIQLVSLRSIDVSGTIAADGLAAMMNDGTGGTSFGGGGGGGGILLEAPHVALSVSGKLLARGGGGNSGDFQPVEVPDSDTPIAGGITQVNDGTRSNGGAGGTDTVNPRPGASTPAAVSGESAIRVAGGGGGGVGRIRINTSDASVDKQSSSVLAGRVTTGVVTAK
jgi:hypothetical protein